MTTVGVLCLGLVGKRRRAIWRLVTETQLRKLSTTQNNTIDPRAEWEAKASKEAKGGDPYKTFGSVTADVSPKPFCKFCRFCRVSKNNVLLIDSSMFPD